MTVVFSVRMGSDTTPLKCIDFEGRLGLCSNVLNVVFSVCLRLSILIFHLICQLAASLILVVFSPLAEKVQCHHLAEEVQFIPLAGDVQFSPLTREVQCRPLAGEVQLVL